MKVLVSRRLIRPLETRPCCVRVCLCVAQEPWIFLFFFFNLHLERKWPPRRETVACCSHLFFFFGYSLRRFIAVKKILCLKTVKQKMKFRTRPTRGNWPGLAGCSSAHLEQQLPLPLSDPRPAEHTKWEPSKSDLPSFTGFLRSLFGLLFGGHYFIVSICIRTLTADYWAPQFGFSFWWGVFFGFSSCPRNPSSTVEAIDYTETS